ncbi:MAG TPA: hypothetical protein VMU94_31950 [Streptosporangiaceae bacterium]|nr:hypothetical protein [Streptosporangiaceae bacterium]
MIVDDHDPRGGLAHRTAMAATAVTATAIAAATAGHLHGDTLSWLRGPGHPKPDLGSRARRAADIS